MNRRKTLATVLLGLAATSLGGAIGMTHASAAGPVTQYTMVPTPIAPQASLAPNATVNVTLTAFDSTGTPVPSATVFLTDNPTTLGGTAKVGTTTLSRVPTSAPTDANGQIVISYKAGTATGGMDTILAQDNTTTPTVTATDTYDYSPMTKITMQPKPIAPTHSLTAGQKVNVTVTAFGLNNLPMANAQVYLLLTAAGGANGTALVGTTVLNKHPQLFSTDASGHIVVIYTRGIATAGKDKITAEDAKHSPSLLIMDTYTY
jgi:hypothetical protein